MLTKRTDPQLYIIIVYIDRENGEFRQDVRTSFFEKLSTFAKG